MQWFEMRSLPYDFDDGLAATQLHTVRNLAQVARRAMTHASARPEYVDVAVWGAHYIDRGRKRLPVFLLDARQGNDRNFGFQALLRSCVGGWVVSVISAGPCPTGILRLPACREACTWPTESSQFSDHMFGTYEENPARFTVGLPNDVELAVFFSELTRRGSQKMDYAKNAALDSLPGVLLIQTLVELDGEDSALARSTRRCGKCAADALSAAYGPDRTLDIDFSVNGIELPFVEVVNKLAKVSEDDITRRARKMLDERRNEAIGALSERFDRIVRDFEARLDEAFPTTKTEDSCTPDR